MGRLTGLVASVLLLAQVLLMARVPLLERAFGQDRLARQHRLVGFTSFDLMLAHIVLITWGYALGDVGQVPQTFWNLTVTYPGMLLALGRHGRPRPGRGDQHQGGAEEAAVRVLAPDPPLRLPRRRPRAAAPAVDRQDFTSSPGRTVFWWTAWAAAAGAVLVWRVGLPLWTARCGTTSA